MIITRLKKDEEELPMSFVEYIAVFAMNNQVSTYVRKASQIYTLPKFLKHVKTVDDKKYVLLCKKNLYDPKTSLSIFDESLFRTFLVPEILPITKKQYTAANNAWPCYFFPHKEDKIDLNYLQKHVDLINTHATTNNVGCCSACIIFDKDKILAYEEDTNHVFLHAVFVAVEKVSIAKHGYLCTGLEALVYKEPCIACAMAFTHGRIKRVFFIKHNPENPTFSVIKLCYNKSLNHRYNAYKVELNKS